MPALYFSELPSYSKFTTSVVPDGAAALVSTVDIIASLSPRPKLSEVGAILPIDIAATATISIIDIANIDLIIFLLILP